MRVDLASLSVVAAIDPAGSRVSLKSQAARMALICIGGDPNGNIFVLYEWADRVSAEKFVDRILWLCATFHPTTIGCESNALQSLFADTTQMLARARGQRLPLVDIAQPTRVDKDTRIRLVLQPIIAHGRLFLLDGQTALRDEILAFPQHPRKDLIDVLASAVNLLPARVPIEQRDRLASALTAYHKKVGTPPSLLEYRLQELRGKAKRIVGDAPLW